MTIAIAAAGTGGHVIPALTVAGALVARGIPPGEVVFLGGDRYESTAVPAAGYGFAGFDLVRLHRSLSPANLRIPWALRRTSGAMADTLRTTGAGVVIGMSGYVTVPAAMAARRAGVPFLVHEQNAEPTLSVRYGSRRAVATLLGLPGPAERLPRTVVVGNPLRPEIAAFDRAALRSAARARYGLPAEGPVVGVMGGSLGAQVLNETAPAIAAGGVALLHLTGPAAAGVGKGTAAPSLPWVRVPFETRMEDFYAAVDLVVCRAGAMTVSELAATGTPSILVPLERVRQDGNAAVLAAAGAAIVVRQRDVARVPGLVADLVADTGRSRAMAAAATGAARPDAAAVVADHLLDVLRG